MSITKEKQMLYFYTTRSEKPYAYNINTLEFFGLLGKPIKKVPTEVMYEIRNNQENNNVVKMLSYLTYDCVYKNRCFNTTDAVVVKKLQFADRLQSVGYSFHQDDIRYIVNNTDVLNFLEKHFKKFVKYVAENRNNTINDFYQHLSKTMFFEENHIVIDEHFTQNMADFLYANCRNDNVLSHHCSDIVYLFKNGVYDFLYNVSTRNITSVLRTYFNYLDNLEWKITGNNFIRSFVEAKRAYELRKYEFDNKKIAEHQNGKINALSFEDDTFIVIVPMTSQEIITEGENQHNCVGRLYLPKVISKDTHIVFVRKKSDPMQSYVTCEVNNRGCIVQYLTTYNCRPDAQASEFRAKYQEHLTANW